MRQTIPGDWISLIFIVRKQNDGEEQIRVEEKLDFPVFSLPLHEAKWDAKRNLQSSENANIPEWWLGEAFGGKT